MPWFRFSIQVSRIATFVVLHITGYLTVYNINKNEESVFATAKDFHHFCGSIELLLNDDWIECISNMYQALVAANTKPKTIKQIDFEPISIV